MPRIFRLSTFLSEASPRRRILLAVGLVSFIGGISLLGLALTSGGSEEPTPPAGPALIDANDLDLDKIERPLVTAPPEATPVPAPVAPLGDQPYRVVIERIGVNAPVDSYGLDAYAVPEVPTGAGAKHVVAWYEFSARPGTGSNAVFAGHVTWNGQAVFFKLSTVDSGDIIRLQGTDGTELVYTVSDIWSVDPSDPDAVRVMDPTNGDVITLITCGGTFTDTNDPVFGGNYNQRLVVRASLTSVNAAPAAGG
jgi:LPXTG-site transpeptidase (sortase) family protein